jgi:glycosyltransferase involved in cell wall biosynthesis
MSEADHEVAGSPRHAHDDVVGHDHLVLGAGGANRVFELAVPGPLLGPMRGRRWREKEPGIVDQDAVVGMAGADRGQLGEHGALVVHSSGLSAAPVTVEPVQRRLRCVDELVHQVPRASTADFDARHGRERGPRRFRERRRHLDRDHLWEDRGEKARAVSAIGSRLDGACEPQTAPELFSQLLGENTHGAVLSVVKPVADSSFLIVANGTPDSPPASGVREFLSTHARELTTVFHPLNPDDPPLHRVARWQRGTQVFDRTLRRPSRPPFTYVLDAVAPLLRPPVDGWLAFSNLSAVHGIARRRVGLAGKVAYWAVDFVPDRFGSGSALSRVYDSVDRLACRRADLRVELTAAARDARAERLDLGADAAPTHVAPVGIWLDRIERVPDDGWTKRKVVFIGHLVPRQGVAMLIEALALLPDVTLDIAGRGPEDRALRDLVERRGLQERVSFLGFLSDHRDVEQLVSTASVAAAPYATDVDSFTKYADPSKLRTYTGAGLPIVTTAVPPNARELERHAGATVVPYEAEPIANAIEEMLSSPQEWQRRRAAALSYANGFDWGRIVPEALARLGFEA